MSRGGGGGGRGRGAKPSVFTPQLLGHLDFAEINKISKLGHILYPDHDEGPYTEEPDEEEAKKARKFYKMISGSKFTPYWKDAPVKASTEVERYSDRFQASSGMEDGTAIPLLESTHLQRNYDRSLLPNAVFEAVFERKTKSKGGENRRSKVLKSATDTIGDGDDGDTGKNLDENSDSEVDGDAEEIEEEEDYDDENDYADNYFSGGDGDDADALGGGGDEDGGTFD